ncbi:MAG: hypothetical protein NC205_07245 [Prevotella sp.]|nr:hypothetical protein [Alistipes senegalensis]MCM1358374.1 hypothetical protein [Prevotella sp.]MCM1472729.1 hypothetical protein [Muribaculaceae bacterium]
MGNRIYFKRATKDDYSLKMSNGLTDVFIDGLLIGGSELARTESQKRLIVFLAEKQQAVVGLGTVGFDIIEMPWQTETFDADKKFMLEVINYVRQEKWWHNLEYTPLPEHIAYALNGFEILINQMTVNDIDEDNLNEWISEADSNDPIYCGYPKCPKHGLILSALGCKFCNDKI